MVFPTGFKKYENNVSVHQDTRRLQLFFKIDNANSEYAVPIRFIDRNTAFTLIIFRKNDEGLSVDGAHFTIQYKNNATLSLQQKSSTEFHLIYEGTNYIINPDKDFGSPTKFTSFSQSTWYYKEGKLYKCLKFSVLITGVAPPMLYAIRNIGC